MRVVFLPTRMRGRITRESSTRVVIERKVVERRAVPLTQRSLARIAGVNRSYPHDLVAAGILGSSLELEDALVTMCLAAVPLRWTRGIDDPTVRTGLLETVAGVVRQYVRSGDADSVIAVTRDRAQRVSRSSASSMVDGAQDALLLLPVGVWWQELASASEDAGVAMT